MHPTASSSMARQNATAVIKQVTQCIFIPSILLLQICLNFSNFFRLTHATNSKISTTNKSKEKTHPAKQQPCSVRFTINWFCPFSLFTFEYFSFGGAVSLTRQQINFSPYSFRLFTGSECPHCPDETII